MFIDVPFITLFLFLWTGLPGLSLKANSRCVNKSGDSKESPDSWVGSKWAVKTHGPFLMPLVLGNEFLQYQGAELIAHIERLGARCVQGLRLGSG